MKTSRMPSGQVSVNAGHPRIVANTQIRGVRCEFLPPYSPDYNPIELAFSAMKYHLQRNGDYVRFAMTDMTDREIYLALQDALYQVTPNHCYGWYRHCGYV